MNTKSRYGTEEMTYPPVERHTNCREMDKQNTILVYFRHALQRECKVSIQTISNAWSNEVLRRCIPITTKTLPNFNFVSSF